MKKSVAVLMILAIVLSLGASAFAERIPDGYYPDFYPDDYYPQGQQPQGKPAVSNVGLLICLMEDDTIHQFVPMYQVTNVEYKDRDKLAKADAEALKEAHDAAKQIEGKSLKQSYFFTVPDFYDVDEEHYAKYVFSCPGNNVEVCVNGNPVEVADDTDVLIPGNGVWDRRPPEGSKMIPGMIYEEQVTEKDGKEIREVISTVLLFPEEDLTMIY